MGDWVNIEGVFTKQANPHTKGTDWSVDWFELYEEKETEMTAEQIRSEIIRIDVRIEEANKDIENAQEERNSLVEKLREKGFVLADKKSSVSDNGERFEVGDEVVIIDNIAGHGFDDNQVVTIQRDDGGHYLCKSGSESWYVDYCDITKI